MKGSWGGPGGKFLARDRRFTAKKNRRLEMERTTTASQNMAATLSVDSAKGRKLSKKKHKNYGQRNFPFKPQASRDFRLVARHLSLPTNA